MWLSLLNLTDSEDGQTAGSFGKNNEYPVPYIQGISLPAAKLLTLLE